MSASALISVDEYLRRAAKPNAEYSDGALFPKPMPTALHAWIQSVLILLLSKQGKIALPELTVRVNSTTFLVPDVAVVRTLQFPYPTDPAELCVEILSPDDRPGVVLSKCEKYHGWGVPYCWVIDPVAKAAWEYHASSQPVLLEGVSVLRAGSIEVSLTELFELPGPGSPP